MSRRHVILALVLVTLTLGAGIAAWCLWQRQQLTVTALAGVPAAPDLSHWPAEFTRRLQAEESTLRQGREPVAALGRIAALYLANGFAREADQAIAALRRLEPANARWPYLAADLRLRAADHPGAESALREVTTLDPAYVPAWIRLGDLLVERGALPEAETCYTRAAAFAPGNVRATFARISFQAFHGKGGDPRRDLTALVQAHPGIRQPHELLDRIHEAAGDAGAAAQQRRLAAATRRYVSLDDPWLDELSSDCFDPNRLSLLAGKMEREGRYDEAVIRIERAILLAPTEPALRDTLAQLRVAQDRPGEAVAVLQKAVVECPDDPGLPERLALLLRTGRRHAEAAAVLRQALTRWPQRAALHTALGQALREAGQPQPALSALREALRLDPTQPEAHYALGFCLLATGQRADARAAIAQALAIRPDYPEALQLLASLAIEEGDVTAAEGPVERLMSLRPDDDNSRLLFALLHLIKGLMARDAGDPVAAERFFRTGLGVLPDFPDLLREHGLLLQRMGRTDEARQSFERGSRAAEAAGNSAQAAEFRKLLGR